MKTRFTNAMCAHVWAQQSQEFGNSDHMRFEKDTIYSYQTPIARIVRLTVGSVALVTSQTYSMTTSSKHMPAVHRALPNAMTVFRVPNVRAISKREHTENLADLVLRYTRQLLTHRRMLSEPYSYDNIEELATVATEYASAFDLPPPDIDPTADIEAIKAYRAARDARNNSPAGIAKRERSKAKRAEYAANKEARDRAKQQAALDEAVTRFRAGGPRVGYIGGRWPFEQLDYPRVGMAALLRVSSDGTAVETSQGATVPVEDARVAIQVIARIKRSGKPWRANGERLPVGDFQINSVDAEGNIVAGCHRIQWSEIAALAAALAITV